MKKTKFLIPGSWKERQYITKMLGEGWQLVSVKGCCYQFEPIDSEMCALTLSIDFLDKQLPSEEKDALTHQGQQFVERKLPFYQHTILYLYGSHEAKTLELSEQTTVELAFLNRFSDHILNIKNIMIVIMMLGWTALLTLDGTKKVVIPTWLIQMPLVILFVLWLLSLVIRHQTRKKIKFLEKQTGIFNEAWAPTRTIILRNLPKRPDMDAFLFLGKWRFVTSNKRRDTFYYELQSHYSEEEIKANIIEELGIMEHQITVVSSLGLFPLGWFGFS